MSILAHADKTATWPDVAITALIVLCIIGVVFCVMKYS